VSANLNYEIFNAGRQKGWGLRAAKQICHSNLALFEYAGILKMADTFEADEDDYIFGFEHVKKFYFLLNLRLSGPYRLYT